MIGPFFPGRFDRVYFETPIVYSHGPLGPVSTGVLLDLPVRTDTKGVSGGSKGVVSDPFLPIRCEVCFKPLSLCCCIPGKDY